MRPIVRARERVAQARKIPGTIRDFTEEPDAIFGADEQG